MRTLRRELPVRRRISSPELVGRREELGLIDDLLAQARDGEASLCIVAGEAGVGKTRLVRELERRAAEAGMLCLRGQCVALAGGEFPFAPLAGIYRALAGAAAVRGLDPAARRLLDVLLGPPGTASPPPEPIAPVHAHDAMLELLRRAAAEQPAAIVIEDLHWADESTADFLRATGARARARAARGRRHVPHATSSRPTIRCARSSPS